MMSQTQPPQRPPALLKAIELILANPSDVKRRVDAVRAKVQKRQTGVADDKVVLEKVANRLISAYSTKAGISGGATALIGVIPGLGTAVELFGGATADMALCLKYQVEMSMALAVLYGQDIEQEADRKRYFIIAGLSTINLETVKQGSDQAARIFSKLVQRYLRDATYDTLKVLFRKVSITLSKKAVQKAIPFGIGAVIGFTSNKTLTWMVGQRVKTFFATAEHS